MCVHMFEQVGLNSEYYGKCKTCNWSGGSYRCEHVNFMHIVVMHFMVLLVEIGHCSGGVYVTSGVDKSLPMRGVCDLSGSIE